MRRLHLTTFILTALLLPGCNLLPKKHYSHTKPPSTERRPEAPAPILIDDPTQLLAASWTSRKPNDPPKLFFPGPGTYQQGEHRGFWPEGGRYILSHADSASRTVHLSAFSRLPEQAFHTFEADIQFSRDGRKMTFTRSNRNGLTEKIIYFRIR